MQQEGSSLIEELSPPRQAGAATGEPKPKRRRNAIACDLCRAKKTRCNGERPCVQCSERGLDCVYPAQKPHVISKTYIEELEARNRQLTTLLLASPQYNVPVLQRPPQDSALPGSSQLAPLMAPYPVSQEPPPTLAFLSPVLRSASSNLPSNVAVTSVPLPAQHPVMTLAQPVSAENVPSLEPLSVPSTSSKEATQSGEVYGRSSTFSFMDSVVLPESPSNGTGSVYVRSLRPSRPPSPAARPFSTAQGRRSARHEASPEEDLAVLPRRFEADSLVDAYFNYRHPTNPYFHPNSFRARYARLWLGQEDGGEESNEDAYPWLALLNIVMCFGHDHLRSSSPDKGERLYPNLRSRYFARARSLAAACVLQTPTIELTQAWILIAQYLHVSLELSRSWQAIGMAVNSAMTLGLQKSPSRFTINLVEQETRRRTYWGCFVLERILAMKVGAQPVLPDSLEVGLPLSIDDEYLDQYTGHNEAACKPAGLPSKTEYFTHAIALCRLTQRLLSELYSSESPKRKSLGVQCLLSLAIRLDGDLLDWRASLPSHLMPDSTQEGWTFMRQRSILHMRFLSNRLLIHRQALLICFRDRVTDEYQREILHLSVKRCVFAAIDIISQMERLYQKQLAGSWWHNSYYIFSAVGVLLAYSIMDNRSYPTLGLNDSVNIVEITNRGIRFLENVGEHLQPVAARYVRTLGELQSRASLSNEANQQQVPWTDLIPEIFNDMPRPPVTGGTANHVSFDLAGNLDNREEVIPGFEGLQDLLFSTNWLWGDMSGEWDGADGV